MKTLTAPLLALAALTLSTPAQAGVGATAGLYSLTDGTSWVPSIDLRKGPVLLQFHALDLIGGLPADTINLGVDGAYLVKKAQAGEDVEGVIMLGGGFRFQTGFDFEHKQFNLVARTRMGAEMKKGAGIGLYVVPVAGVSNFGRDEGVGFVYGGGVELSAWLK